MAKLGWRKIGGKWLPPHAHAQIIWGGCNSKLKAGDVFRHRGESFDVVRVRGAFVVMTDKQGRKAGAIACGFGQGRDSYSHALIARVVK